MFDDLVVLEVQMIPGVNYPDKMNTKCIFF